MRIALTTLALVLPISVAHAQLAPATSGTVADNAPVSVGTSSTTVVPAAAGIRYRALLTNTSTTAGNTAWCRADGGAAAVGTGVPLPSGGGGYEWDYPLTGAAPAPAINCVAASATAIVATETVQ